MQRKSVKELIAELQQLRIRDTIVIAEIREAVQGANEANGINAREDGIDVDPVFRKNMMEAEARIVSELQSQIDGFLQ